MGTKNNFNLRDLTFYFAVAMMATVVGCAKSSDSSPAPAAAAAVVCAPNTPCTIAPTNIGYYAESQSMKSYYNTNNSILTPNGNYATFLKEALGVCDREQYTGGLAACNAWIQGYHDIVFQMDNAASNTVRVVVRAYPYNSGGTYYSYQLPTWSQFFLGLVGFPVAQNPSGFFNPMILNASIYPINASQGFEIRAYGPQVSYGYNKLLQLQVASGKVNVDSQFNFILNWNGQPVATGTMVRCQTQNCGL